MLVTKTSHLKNGLNRLFSLVPYEVINNEIYDYVMPHWLEAIVNDVPENDLPELKMLLRLKESLFMELLECSVYLHHQC